MDALTRLNQTCVRRSRSLRSIETRRLGLRGGERVNASRWGVVFIVYSYPIINRL